MNMKKRMSLLTLSPYYSQISSPFVYLSLTTVTNSFATAFASSSPPPTTTTTSTGTAKPPPLSNICIVGGTHGNEYTGVWTIKSLARQLPTLSTRYPSLSISTLLGNPAAFAKGTRFVDVDLNRQFTRSVLLPHNNQEKKEEDEEEAVEIKRAKELNQLLGPKFPTSTHPHPPRTDVILDLHTTTANVGATLIIPEGDIVAALCAAYAVHSCASSSSSSSSSSSDQEEGTTKPTQPSFDIRIILHTHPDRASRPNLPSIAKHGWTVEVGPIPTSTVRDDTNQQTRRIVESLLECLELWNTKGEDYLRSRLCRVFGKGKVPCFRSIRPSQNQSQNGDKKNGTVATMSSKIAWPSSRDNPNFPEWVIDQSVQDRDFTLPISKGDVVFRDLDGTSIRYDGRFGSPIRLMFVNEAGYYLKESGTGISVVEEAEFCLDTGRCVVVEKTEEKEVVEVSKDGEGRDNKRKREDDSEEEKGVVMDGKESSVEPAR